jgi:hypothetical protein
LKLKGMKKHIFGEICLIRGFVIYSRRILLNSLNQGGSDGQGMYHAWEKSGSYKVWQETQKKGSL